MNDICAEAPVTVALMSHNHWSVYNITTNRKHVLLPQSRTLWRRHRLSLW